MADQDLLLAIGRLQAQLKESEKNDAQAAESRKETNQNIAQIASSMTDMQTHMSRMDERLTEIEPVVKDFSRWRERWIGARWTLSLLFAGLFTLLGGALTTFWDKLLHFIGLK